MNIKSAILIVLGVILATATFAQNSIKSLSAESKKNDYAILEVRLNMEDEFRTLEGRDHDGLSRISLYTGSNKGNEILSKGFLGNNQVVDYLNEMKNNGWVLEETYSIMGTSLILTNFVFRKKK